MARRGHHGLRRRSSWSSLTLSSGRPSDRKPVLLLVLRLLWLRLVGLPLQLGLGLRFGLPLRVRLGLGLGLRVAHGPGFWRVSDLQLRLAAGSAIYALVVLGAVQPEFLERKKSAATWTWTVELAVSVYDSFLQRPP